MKRYELYAFMIAGAFSGLAGALITLNERSVYPDLAFWTRSTQVLLMSILGGVYTFFGPIIGAFLLLFMDADITQDYRDLAVVPRCRDGLDSLRSPRRHHGLHPIS